MHKFFAGSAAAALMTFSFQVAAAPIVADAVYGFTWLGDGPVVDAPTQGADFVTSDVGPVTNPGDGPYTFTGGGTFGILDVGIMSDQFAVYDNGELLGATFAPPGGRCGDSLAGCIGAGSSGAYLVLGEGDHSISIMATGRYRGRGVFQWTTGDTDPVVPIPAAAWLFGSALLGLAGIKRKKA